MEAFLDCIACTVTQGLRTARYSSDDPEVQERVMRGILAEFAGADLALTPVELGHIALKVAARETGVADPYRDVRIRSNADALRLYPRLKDIVRASDGPLQTATRIAIAGNIIDFGAVGEDFDVEATVERVLKRPFARDDFGRFAEAVNGAESVLYLADNAGEIVFDRVLMEEMPGRRLTVAVKAEPFINDAMLADAQQVGLGEVAAIIEAPIYPGSNEALARAWREADLIISKGQANYEAYNEAEGPLFFLVLAKCDFVGLSVGVAKGEMMLLAR